MTTPADEPKLGEEALRSTSQLSFNSKKEASEHQHSSSDLSQDDAAPDPQQYATGFRLAMIILTINLSTLIAALDLGIVATAIPSITEDFHSLTDIAWYSGACFLVVGATSGFWGKLFKYLPAQYVYMAALALYLVGSIVAASAAYSTPLIVGRAIQGLGCSGCLGGSVLLINYTAAPKRRPMLIGIWMGIFMISTVLGPVLGGVFTSELTWRWCFWINLPVGGFALVLQVIFLRIKVKPVAATWKELVLQLDLSGLAIILASLVCYTLALQWGGLTKSWSDGSVIATLVVWIVLSIAFVANEWYQGEYAMLPFNLIKPRMTWTNCLYAFVSNAANFQILFYLPVYFQTVKGTTAIISGVYTLPFLAFYAVGCLASGAFIQKTRIVQPIEVVSGLLAVLGAGLFYGLEIDSSKAWYIGAQIPFGIGVGLGTQVPVTALQAFADPEHVATTMGIIFTCQTISGAYFVTAGQSILENRLLHSLNTQTIAPGLDPAAVLNAGATALQNSFSGADLTAVLEGYMVALKDVFAFSIAAAALTVFVAMAIPMKRIPSFELPAM